jgi:hypothetical protein
MRLVAANGIKGVKRVSLSSRSALPVTDGKAWLARCGLNRENCARDAGDWPCVKPQYHNSTAMKLRSRAC